MSSISPQTLWVLADQLIAVAAGTNKLNPATSVALAALLRVSKQLADLIAEIKKSDPDLWAKVVADYEDALAEWDASVARQLEQQTPSD